MAAAVGLMVCAVPGRGVAQVAAQTPDTGAAPRQSAATLEAGVEERFRYEHFNNLADHSAATPDERLQWRFRTRVWAIGTLGDHVAFGVGLSNESRGQGVPRVPLTLDETVFSALWVDLRPHPRMTLRLGRQNVMKGDGFIFHDGTPGDGARTEYVNGLDATIHVARNATLEAIAAWDPSYDTFLPVIHDQHRRLIEWEERLAGVYYTDARKPGLLWQAYYLFKREQHDDRPPTHPQFQPDRSLSTFGGRLERARGTTWTLFGEWAAQVGTQVPDTPIRAWGGMAGVQRRFSVPWSPAVRLAYTALSGASDSTNVIGGWDPVLGRWPLWSEAIVQALIPEVGVAYWTNMGLLKGEVLLTPSSRTGARATYYHLTAFHPFQGTPLVFGSGTTRGDLFVARFDVLLNARLRGHVLYERFLPGSFYVGHAPGYLFRVELLAAFQHRW
jgi:hypothetical protein